MATRPLTASAGENYATAVSFIVLTALAMALRFAIRIRRRQWPFLSDWLCLASLPLFYAFCGVILNFVFKVSLYGALDMDPSLGAQEMSNLLLLTYEQELLFTAAITVVKLSICAFYYDIFRIQRPLRVAILVLAGCCVLWCLAFEFVAAFQCDPPRAMWEELQPADKCLPFPRTLLGNELTNLFIDVAILCVPLVGLRSLQLTTGKKWGLAGVFLLGGLVCVTSIVRISYIWNPPDLEANFNFRGTVTWSTVQVGTAIICACLPTYGSLLPYLGWPISIAKSLYTSLLSFRSEEDAPQGGQAQVSEGVTSMQKHSQVWIGPRPVDYVTTAGKLESAVEEHPPGMIVVDREYQVV